MNRLTSERCNGIKTGYWSPAKKEDLCQRLGAYEDTGLEPEEIRSNRDWISTKDRLPDVFQPVIVCRPYDEATVKVEQGLLEPGGWWKVYGTRVRSVTHWMPFPEPPVSRPVVDL